MWRHLQTHQKHFCFFLVRPFIPLIYSRVSYYTSAFWSSWNPQCANQRHQCSPTLCNFFYLQISVHFGFVCSKCSKFGDVIWNEHTGIVFCYNLLSLSKFKWYAILFLCVTHSGGGDSWPINMNDIEFMELANPINTERSFGGDRIRCTSATTSICTETNTQTQREAYEWIAFCLLTGRAYIISNAI